MPAYARRQIVDESVVGVYDCMARCVRRAFLCGFDRYSGRNFDHRKAWVRQRLEELAGFLAVDVLGFPGVVATPPKWFSHSYMKPVWTTVANCCTAGGLSARTEKAW